MPTTTDSPSDFETRLPEIHRLAGFQFRHLDPDAREEAVQNTVALAYRYWLRLVEQGKSGEGVFKGLIWWACRHTKQGRQGGGRGSSKAKCVLDYARRRKGEVVINGGVDLNHFVGPTATVPDTVAFRLDTTAFLSTLPERDQKIAYDLAAGIGTTEVARKRGVTPAAISQFRTRFRKKYDEFHVAI